MDDIAGTQNPSGATGPGPPNPGPASPSPASPRPTGPGPASPNCPGVPRECEFARSHIAVALEAWQEEHTVQQVRLQLSECANCLFALEAEINLRRTLQIKSADRAPRNLRINISQTLGRIKLDGITEMDL